MKFLRKIFGIEEVRPTIGDSRFTYYKSLTSGQWYWTLQAPNGEKVCQSEGYVTEAGAMNGVDAVRRYAAGAVLVRRDIA